MMFKLKIDKYWYFFPEIQYGLVFVQSEETYVIVWIQRAT